MIGAHATEPGSTPAPRRAPTAGRTLRALLLLAVAAGLVLMHHVAGAHQHAPDQPTAKPAQAAQAADAAHAVRSPAAEPAPTHQVSASEHSTTAALHVHHDQAGHGDVVAVLHLCLAVLAAALALAFSTHLIGRRFDLERERPAPAAPRRRRSRPPLPVPLLLAQLQVLRL